MMKQTNAVVAGRGLLVVDSAGKAGIPVVIREQVRAGEGRVFTLFFRGGITHRLYDERADKHSD
jgi:hypothetical protein